MGFPEHVIVASPAGWLQKPGEVIPSCGGECLKTVIFMRHSREKESSTPWGGGGTLIVRESGLQDSPFTPAQMGLANKHTSCMCSNQAELKARRILSGVAATRFVQGDNVSRHFLCLQWEPRLTLSEDPDAFLSKGRASDFIIPHAAELRDSKVDCLSWGALALTQHKEPIVKINANI